MINKAKNACENVGHIVADHFPDVRKMVSLGSGSERNVDAILLTRYACYLVAQNGSHKSISTIMLPSVVFSWSVVSYQKIYLLKRM